MPQIPMLFMGEEWASDRPFNFFTDFHGELADAVREGRRKEFAGFAEFSDPEARKKIPDPNEEADLQGIEAGLGRGRRTVACPVA